MNEEGGRRTGGTLQLAGDGINAILAMACIVARLVALPPIAKVCSCESLERKQNRQSHSATTVIQRGPMDRRGPRMRKPTALVTKFRW